jgi:hypothetical protein
VCHAYQSQRGARSIHMTIELWMLLGVEGPFNRLLILPFMGADAKSRVTGPLLALAWRDFQIWTSSS